MADDRFEFPTTGIAVEQQAILLAIDDALLPLKKNLCYYLSRPTVRPEAVLTPQRDKPNAPDYTATHFYGTVLLDEGLGLFPDAEQGSVWSAPIILPAGGCAITLNADGASGIRMELADDRFRLLPDYSGAGEPGPWRGGLKCGARTSHPGCR